MEILEFIKAKLREKKEKKMHPQLVTNFEIWDEYPTEERTKIKEELRRLCNENILVAGITINGWFVNLKQNEE
jgi:hypothetical protein